MISKTEKNNFVKRIAILCTLMLALWPSMSNAQQLERDEVMGRARRFFAEARIGRHNAGGRKLQNVNQLELIASSEILSPDSLPADKVTGEPVEAFYVARPSDGGNGFVVVSADSRRSPILGYSYDNAFVTEDMPDNVRAFYQELASSTPSGLIVPVNSSNVLNRLPLKEGGVGPLVKTQWGQDDPYNRQCPEISGERCVTGCVATAMAQVMKKFEWPKVAKGSNSYTHSKLGTVSATFEGTEYDWANMTNTYSRTYDWDEGEYHATCSEEEANAVSELMWHCGASVKMNYNTGASGASMSYVSSALLNYFGYDADIAFCYKTLVTSTVHYYKMMIMEINAGRPVMYGSGSHCYIVDGYKEDDDANVPLMHVNMGWTGMYDGYYLMNDQDASDGNSFADHEIIWGIQPEDGICRPIYKFIDSNSKHEYIIKRGTTTPISWYPNLILFSSKSYTSANKPKVNFTLYAIDKDGKEYLICEACNDNLSSMLNADVSQLPIGDYLLEWRSQVEGQEDYTLLYQEEMFVYVYDEEPVLEAAFVTSPPKVIDATDFKLEIDVTNRGNEDYYGSIELHIATDYCTSTLASNGGVTIPKGETVRVMFDGMIEDLGDGIANVTLHNGYNQSAINGSDETPIGFSAECRPIRSETIFYQLYMGYRSYYGNFVNACKGVNLSRTYNFKGDVGTALVNEDGNIVKVWGIGSESLNARETSYMGYSLTYPYFNNYWEEFPNDVPDGEYGLRLVTRQKNSKLWMAPIVNESTYPNYIIPCKVNGTEVTITNYDGTTTTLTRQEWDGTTLCQNVSFDITGYGKVTLNYEELTAGSYVRTVAHNEPATIKFTPDPGYFFRAWLNGNDVTDQVVDGVLTLDNVTSAQQIKVEYNPLLADTNGDGKVSVADLTAAVDKLNGNDVPDFVMATADLNLNGILDEEDIRSIAHLILNGVDQSMSLEELYEMVGLQVHEGRFCVDLGLQSFPNLRWAIANVGAANATDIGNYCSWGEATPKNRYGWEDYKYANGSRDVITRYNPHTEGGDGKSVLMEEDDAAHVLWGGNWRIPTPEEWAAVIAECEMTYYYKSSKYGVEGYEVTGPNGKTIFLPYGYPQFYISGGMMFQQLTAYWTNTVDTEYDYNAQVLSFGFLFTRELNMTSTQRAVGAFVRPVFTASQP